MKKYLVVIMSDDGSVSSVLESSSQIVARIDMADCSNEKIRVFDTDDFENGPVEINMFGPWTQPKDPLLIIGINSKNGSIEMSGYGTDH